jgi:hypothetical protein
LVYAPFLWYSIVLTADMNADYKEREDAMAVSSGQSPAGHNSTASTGTSGIKGTNHQQQQQDKDTPARTQSDAVKRQLAQGRARAAIEDERIQRTRRKVDSMWQSLE